MNPWLIIAAGIFWVVSVGGAYVRGQMVGGDRVIAKQASVDQAVQKTREAAIQAVAEAIAAQKPINTTIVQKVQREVQTNTVYRDCKLPPAGVLLANQALTGKPPEPAGGQQLPGTVAPK